MQHTSSPLTSITKYASNRIENNFSILLLNCNAKPRLFELWSNNCWTDATSQCIRLNYCGYFLSAKSKQMWIQSIYAFKMYLYELYRMYKAYNLYYAAFTDRNLYEIWTEIKQAYFYFKSSFSVFFPRLFLFLFSFFLFIPIQTHVFRQNGGQGREGEDRRFRFEGVKMHPKWRQPGLLSR